MKVHRYSAGETVYRYGGTGQDCYFVLQGRVELKAPVTEEVTVKTEKELIQYCAANMNSIIWEKVEDGYEMKALAQQYLDDPEGYDLLEQDAGADKHSASHGRASGQYLRNDPVSSRKGSNAGY